MRNVWIIARRDFAAYFHSATAYIVAATFLLLVNFFFFWSFFTNNIADVRSLFMLIAIMSAFFAPAITMRLIAEERRSRSIELLLSYPLTKLDVILGKYLAAIMLYAVMLLFTLAAPLSISAIAQLDWGPIIGSYIGALLLGSVYLGFGLLASTMTKSQLVAVILGIAMALVVSLGFEYARMFLPGAVASVLEYLGVLSHFNSLARGVIDTRDILYYLSVSSFLVALSVYFLDREAA